jgi:hypothetical protein
MRAAQTLIVDKHAALFEHCISFLTAGGQSCVSTTTAKLPLESIPAGRIIDDCVPEQLAMLLAVGVMRGGGRAAILRQNKGAVRAEFFKPLEN